MANETTFADHQRTTRYRPSNASEGVGFEAQFCDLCEREAAWRKDAANDACAIHMNALAYRVTSPSYPKEWTYAEGKPTCTAWVPEGQPTPEKAAKDRARYEAAMAEMRATLPAPHATNGER